jgi:hypothetical protein
MDFIPTIGVIVHRLSRTSGSHASSFPLETPVRLDRSKKQYVRLGYSVIPKAISEPIPKTIRVQVTISGIVYKIGSFDVPQVRPVPQGSYDTTQYLIPGQKCDRKVINMGDEIREMSSDYVDDLTGESVKFIFGDSSTEVHITEE